jgi:hypothetical protein
MATPAGVLRIEPNVPQVIALAFSEGKERESQFKNADGSAKFDYLFTLVSGERVYLPEVAVRKIKEAGITARVPFQITKRQNGQTTRWEIETHNQTKAAGFLENPTAHVSMEPTTTTPILNPNTNHYEMPSPKWPRHTPAQQAVVDRKVSDAAEPAPVTGMALKILQSYVVAFDVVARLQDVCEQRGLALNFLQEEHVRAIAATAFIEANKQVRS